MNFDLTPKPIVIDMDEDIRNQIYEAYDKYLKYKSKKELMQVVELICENPELPNRKELFDLDLGNNQTVFDYILTLDGSFDYENAKYLAQYPEYVMKAIKQGKLSILKGQNEDAFFIKINDKTLIEYLIETNNFEDIWFYSIKTHTEIVDILKRHNQTRLLQYVGEDILFSNYDENRKVIDYLLENNTLYSSSVNNIVNHDEIYEYLINYNKLELLETLSPEVLMKERQGKTILSILLESGYSPIVHDIQDKEIVKTFLRYGKLNALENITLDVAFMDVDGTDKKLFEYLAKHGVICHGVVNQAFKRKQNLEEIVRILEENNALTALQMFSEKELIQTYGTDKTLLEKLLENNLYILEDEFKTKEAFNVLLKYNRYDLLTHSSEEVLLETLPNGKKLYEELIEKGYGINTESIVNDEIARKIIETEDEKLLRCLGAECLLSLYDLNRTYLDVILDKAVETKKKSLVGNLRFEDATTNEEAKIIISHVNHGLSGMLADLTLEKLLDDSSGTTLLEELLREDEEITLKLLNNEIKSDLEVATILKLHGIKQKRLKYDSELSPKMKEQYISATLDVYKNMPITEEEEEVLQNFFNVMSDGQTPIEIIDMIAASYQYLFSTNNPYATEIFTLIEIKKQNPNFRIEFGKGAQYSPKNMVITLEDLNPEVFHHELGHAFFHIIGNATVPVEFEELVERLAYSLAIEVKLTNYTEQLNRTTRKVQRHINSNIIIDFERNLDEDEIRLYLESLKDGAIQRYVDRGYNEADVRRIVSQTFSIEEFKKQTTRITRREMLDAILRIEHAELPAIGDYFDGIYRGKYFDGKIRNCITGTRFTGGYGHGSKYYSDDTDLIFNEMLANYSAIMKTSNPQIGSQKLNQYMNPQLVSMIENSYIQMALQQAIIMTNQHEETIKL